MKVKVILEKRSHNFNTGIDRYASELIKHINTFNHCTLDIIYLPKKSKLEIIKGLLFNSSNKKQYGTNLVHNLAPIDLGSSKFNNNLITTVHDICPLIIPESYPVYMPFLFKRNLKKLIKQGSYFITNSECTKKDLKHFFNVPDDKIFVTYLGVSDDFIRPRNEIINHIKKKYNLPENYFLFTGSMNKRKNLDTVINAFVKFKQNSNSDVKLVLAGRMNWGGSEIKNKIEVNNLLNEVVLPGYIDDEDLPGVVGGAKAMLYLSLYEGFGFPALEAMKVGTPVIASNVSSIPEVVEEAGILVDPKDIGAIIGAMQKIIENSDFKNSLIEKGFTQAKKFSWKKTVSETLGVYEKINNKIHD